MKVLNPLTQQEYREKAITDPNDLVIGGTYYLNLEHKVIPIKLLELYTHKEHYNSIGLETNDESTDYRWAKVEYINDSNGNPFISLFDSNVGACYNPWMMFENYYDALGAAQDIKIDWETDDWYPEFEEGYACDEY